MDNPAGEEGINLPIEWSFEGIISRYATNMVVTHTAHEFVVSFFEISPPFLFSEAEVEKATSVKAECVARVIIAANRMQEFVDVLQGNLNTYRSRFVSEESDHDNGE